MAQFNPYHVLGVSVDAPTDAVIMAFRDKVQELGQSLHIGDPAYGKQLAVLRQAVSILTDPERREQCDADLLKGDGAIDPTDITFVWQMVNKLYYERSDRYTPVFDALRASVPIALEGDDLFIIGIEHAQSRLLSYVNSAEVHAALRQILSEVCGRPFDFRIILGTNLREWQLLHESEQKAEQQRQERMRAPQSRPPVATTESGRPLLSGMASTRPAPAPPPTPTPPPASDEWEEAMESLMRLWSGTESRNFPQVRGRLIIDSLMLIAKTEDAARGKKMPDDLLQRALARALERVGSLTGTDSALIAIEYLRMREGRNL